MTGARRWVAGVGLVAVLAAFGALLVTSYTLIAFSDPTKWYTFARDFTASFGSVRLAYGFPLVQAAAISLVGPFRGFLVNAPVLVALVGVVYAFARLHVEPARDRGDLLSAELVGAGAVSFLLVVNWPMWLHVVNPYRDPLSHLGWGIACAGLIVWVRGERHSRAGLVGIGCALAFAAASRETAVFLLAPMALYTFVCRRGGTRSLVDLGWLGGAVGIASVPLLVQNALVSGNPVMPAQMLRGMQEQREFVPGIRFENWVDTLPAVLEHLATSYGWAGSLVVVGLGAAAVRRMPVALALTLPALLLHLLFYGAYVRPVPRYLLIIDLFAAPLAGLGAAWLVAVASRAIASERARERVTTAAVALAFVPGLWVCVSAIRTSEPTFQLPQARQLRADLLERLPPGAAVMGERPLAEIVQCFAGDVLDVDHRPVDDAKLIAKLREHAVVYVLTHQPVGPGSADGYAVERIASASRDRNGFSDYLLYEVRAEPRSRHGP